MYCLCGCCLLPAAGLLYGTRVLPLLYMVLLLACWTLPGVAIEVADHLHFASLHERFAREEKQVLDAAAMAKPQTPC